jgi:hypothetical protein
MDFLEIDSIKKNIYIYIYICEYCKGYELIIIEDKTSCKLKYDKFKELENNKEDNCNSSDILNFSDDIPSYTKFQSITKYKNKKNSNIRIISF